MTIKDICFRSRAIHSSAPAERAAIVAVAADKVAFRGLFLTADLATRIARVGHRAGDASDADARVAERQESCALGPLDWFRGRRLGDA
jgi:predicted kinase